MKRILVLVVGALVVSFLARAPAAGLVEPPPGFVHELDSEYGEARIAGTPDGWLAIRPTLGVVQRERFGGQVDVLASGIDGLSQVAYDTTHDDAIVGTSEGRVLRIGDGNVATVATGLAVVGLAVADDGTVYVAVRGGVERIDPDGTRKTLIDDVEYVTAIALDPQGRVLLAQEARLHRLVDGELVRIAGGDRYCAPPDPCGDGGPAVDARFAEITALDVDTDGSIYLTEHRNARIRVIRPDGLVHNLAGSYRACVKVDRFDCIPTMGWRSPIQKVVSITLAGGSLLAIDQDDAWRWTRLACCR